MTDRPMTQPNTSIRLLWTAGWDSTFRLLEALLVRRKAVHPYYLVDPGRPSTPNELRAMERIAAAVSAKYPDTAGLLHKPVIANVGDLRPDPQITGRFERLRARSHLGGQYDWLARFAARQGLTDLELAIHQDDRAAAFLHPHVVKDEGDGDPFYRLRDDPPEDDLLIFEHFRFPVFDKTKRDMQRLAREQGFADLMELTWFCHIPTADGRPCGRCNPCRYTIDEGLARRVPLRTRLRNHRVVERMKRPLRAAATWAGWRRGRTDTNGHE
jgi:queuosine biosynthesis protein QueC